MQALNRCLNDDLILFFSTKETDFMRILLTLCALLMSQQAYSQLNITIDGGSASAIPIAIRGIRTK